MRMKLVGITLVLHLTSCLLASSFVWSIERALPVTDGPGHDGRSFSTAIVVEADSEVQGVNAEYMWIAFQRPNKDVVLQSLVFEGGRAYDILEVAGRDGNTEEIYFDITAFYGRW